MPGAASLSSDLLAALNHPHIAAIYGFEEGSPSTGSGHAGPPALVMELIDGPTLGDRLAGGALPTVEALAIARQIADALEAERTELVALADAETHLGTPRLNGELTRTTFQLRLFAEQVRPRLGRVRPAG